MENTLVRNNITKRLAQLHSSAIKIIQYSSQEHLLEKIASQACYHTGASACSVNLVLDPTKPGNDITVRMQNPEAQAFEYEIVENPIYAQSIFQNMAPGGISARFPPEYRAKLVGLASQHPDVISFLYVPIMQGVTMVGQILAVNKLNERSFSADDQIILETLASYAGIGITNTLLRANLTQRDNSLTRRNENLAMLNTLAATLSSDSEISQMLQDTLDQVINTLHLAAGEVYLAQEDSNLHTLQLHYGDNVDRFWKQIEYKTGQGVVGRVAEKSQSAILDLYEDEIDDLNTNLFNNHIQQLACFPLISRSGSLGVLCVATCQPQPLDDLAVQFLTIISLWVGTVIENARLNLHQRRMAVLEERKRIGMDLHDGIIQSIYAVGLILEHARLLMNEDHDKAEERIEQAIEGLNSTIRDLRSYILDLRPRYLLDENLIQGIQRLVNEFQVNTLVEVSLNASIDEFTGLPETQAMALFHICQEALANIAKHARATSVSVNLWTAAGRALLEVHDDGRGFDVNETRLSLGHGLSNMQMRAGNAGGDVEITSELNGGSTILAWVPFIKPEPTEKPAAETRMEQSAQQE